MTGTILTGLLKTNGKPVELCEHECDRGNDLACGRPAGHPDDPWGHVCEWCAAESLRSQ